MDKETIKEVINYLCNASHSVAKDHGWWEDNRSIGECIALMHSELSEALEYARKDPRALSDHIDATGIEEEFADTIIRIFDYCGKNNLNLGDALVKKMEYNKSRPYKHGKQF